MANIINLDSNRVKLRIAIRRLRQKVKYWLIWLGLQPYPPACRWHKYADPIIYEDDEYFYPLSCSYCGKPLWTKQCKRCHQIFLAWNSQGYDDVMSAPYVTSGGDLVCLPCLREDEEAEERLYEQEAYDDWEYDEAIP